MKINYLAPQIGEFDVLIERGFAGTNFGQPGQPGDSGNFGFDPNEGENF